jgi:ABC-2 type transport system permease protein
MRNCKAVFQRELRSYFTSPIAYAVLAGFLLIAGYFFYAILASFVQYAMRSSMEAQYYQSAAPPINVNLMALRPFFYNVAIIMVFAVPMITMRLYAEEKKTGTIELLLTSPIRSLEIILGKYFAAFVLYATMLACTGIYQIVLFIYGKPEIGQILVSYLGLFLLGGAFVAVGIFISTLTENQIVAGFITLIVLLLFWVIGWVADFAGSAFGSVLGYISLLTHFEEFAKGVIDIKDIVLYLSVTIFFLVLTWMSVESARWRTK